MPATAGTYMNVLLYIISGIQGKLLRLSGKRSGVITKNSGGERKYLAIVPKRLGWGGKALSSLP